MAIRLGDLSPKFCLGDDQIPKVYLGDTLVYPDEPTPVEISHLEKFRVKWTTTTLNVEEVDNV